MFKQSLEMYAITVGLGAVFPLIVTSLLGQPEQSGLCVFVVVVWLLYEHVPPMLKKFKPKFRFN